MSGFGTAVAVEARKALASRVLAATTAILVLGLLALVVGFELGLRAGNPQLAAQLGPLAALEGWPRMLGIVAQITAAGSLLAFGTGLSWLVGREFADGTVSALFALPVSRSAIAAAKLTVSFVWVVLAACAVVVVIAAAGLALGFGVPSAEAVAGLGREFVLLVLTGFVATPAAWAASLGRGVLPGIAASVALLIVAQVFAVAGTGAWFPVVAPALWALDPGAVSGLQLGLVALVPLVAGGATILTWRRLQLDR